MKQSDSKIKESYKYLLRLLSSLICNAQPPKPNANIDWASVYYVAKQHSVVGMACYAIEKLPSEYLPPKEIMTEFSEVKLSEIIIESNIQFETDKLLEKFREKGLKTVLLKGMILKHYYPVSAMRTMSDVDILYKEKDKKAIKAIFADMGYDFVSNLDSELNFNKPPFHHYEMHAYLVRSYLNSYAFFEKVWDNAVEEDNVYYLSLEYTYIYMLEHLARHIECAGAGIRMIMDVFVFLQKERDNLNRVLVDQWLRELNLSEFEKRITSLADNWFSAEEPDLDSPESQFLLDSTTFGLVRNAFIQSNIRKERRSGKKQNSFRNLLSHLFPEYKYICARFPSAKKCKFLYPFYIPLYWFARVFIDKNINTSNISYNFISSDSDEAVLIAKTIKNLGLEDRN